MSDAEIVVAEVAEVVPKVELSPKEALKVVLRNSLYNHGLARGLHEAVKSLDAGQAHFALLSSTCNENAYTKLITALCKERNVPLLMADNGTVIGEMAGLVRLKADGTPAKTINCTCVVVREWGVESDARAVLLNHINSGASKI